MELTNRITDDAIESTKYGLQMTQLENGRLKANRPPAQVTLLGLLNYCSVVFLENLIALNGYRISLLTSCMIKHEVKPSALSATLPPHLEP